MLVPGDGSLSGSFRDGAAASARFNDPSGIVAAPLAGGAGAGKLYIADSGNNRIRAIDLSNNRVTTLAGDGTRASTDHVTGTRAQFGRPKNLALSKDGSTLYVTDYGTHRIRSVDLTGTNEVKTIAGSTRGFADHATGTSAKFSYPAGLAVSEDGSMLYVADSLNNLIRSIDIKSGTINEVKTIAGKRSQGYKDGNGTAAEFNGPTGLAVSGDTLYVTDFGNNRIRAIDLTTNEVTTIAGDGTTGSTDGIGTNAPIGSPVGIAASGSTLYVTTNGGLIRKIEYREVGS